MAFDSFYFPAFVYHACMFTYFMFGEQEKAVEIALKTPIKATEHLYVDGDYMMWSSLVYAGVFLLLYPY